MKYEKLDKYLAKKGIKAENKEKIGGFKNLSTKDKWDLLEKMAKDLGYIE